MQTRNATFSRRRSRYPPENPGSTSKNENPHRNNQSNVPSRVSQLLQTTKALKKRDVVGVSGGTRPSPSTKTQNRANLLPLKLPLVCKDEAEGSVASPQMRPYCVETCNRFSLVESDECDSEDSFNKLLEIASEGQSRNLVGDVLSSPSCARNRSAVLVSTFDSSQENRVMMSQSNRITCPKEMFDGKIENMEVPNPSSKYRSSVPTEGSHKIPAPFSNIPSTMLGPARGDYGSKLDPTGSSCEVANKTLEPSSESCSIYHKPLPTVELAMHHGRSGKEEVPSVQINHVSAENVAVHLFGKTTGARTHSPSNSADATIHFETEAQLHRSTSNPLETQDTAPLIGSSGRKCSSTKIDGFPTVGPDEGHMLREVKGVVAQETRLSKVQCKGRSEKSLNVKFRSANGRKSISRHSANEADTQTKYGVKENHGFLNSSSSASNRDDPLECVSKGSSLNVSAVADHHDRYTQSKSLRGATNKPLTNDVALTGAVMKENKHSTASQSSCDSRKSLSTSPGPTIENCLSDPSAKVRSLKKRSASQSSVKQNHCTLNTLKRQRKRSESSLLSPPKSITIGEQTLRTVFPNRIFAEGAPLSISKPFQQGSPSPRSIEEEPPPHIAENHEKISLTRAELKTQFKSNWSRKEQSNFKFPSVSNHEGYHSSSRLSCDQAMETHLTTKGNKDALQAPESRAVFSQIRATLSGHEEKESHESLSKNTLFHERKHQVEEKQKETMELLDHESGSACVASSSRCLSKSVLRSPSFGSFDTSLLKKKGGISFISDTTDRLLGDHRFISLERESCSNGNKSGQMDLRLRRDSIQRQCQQHADLVLTNSISDQLGSNDIHSSCSKPVRCELVIPSPTNSSCGADMYKIPDRKWGEDAAKEIISVILENVRTRCLSKVKPSITLRLPLLPVKRLRNESGLFTYINNKDSLINEAKSCLSLSSCGASAGHKVYLWDFVQNKRSSETMLLSKAVVICKQSPDSTKFIYDGEDFDFENPQVLSACPILADERLNFLRKDTQSKVLWKIRIWDGKELDLVRFHNSPTLSNLEEYLCSHPLHVVFQPTLALRKCKRSHARPARVAYHSRALAIVLPGISSSEGKEMLLRKVLLKIRELRVTELPEGAQHVRFWNTSTSQKTSAMSFPSRAHLTRYLLQQPHLETDHGQDKLRDLKTAKGFHLMPVYCNCPTELSCLWDSVNKKVCVNPKFPLEANKTTIGDYIRSSSQYEVYYGQDLSEVHSIKRCIDQYSRGGQFPYVYMLYFCPDVVQHTVYGAQWIPSYVDPTGRPSKSKSTFFWNRYSSSLELIDRKEIGTTIQEYVQEHSSTVEPYVGQDLPGHVQVALKRWFQMLRYKPGFADESKIPILLRPCSENELKEETLDSFPVTNEKQTLPTNTSQTGSKEPALKRVKNASNVRSVHGSRVEKDWLNRSDQENSLAPISNQKNDNGTGQKRSGYSEISECVQRQSHSSTTAFLLDNQDFGQIEDVGAVRVSKTLSKFENVRDGRNEEGITPFPGSDEAVTSSMLEEIIRLDDLSYINGSCTDVQNVAGKYVVHAKKKVSEMVKTIKEAGPKILRRELAVDLRQSLRERLILEIKCSKKLHEFAWNVQNAGIGELAVRLLEKLLALDAYSMFSKEIELDLGPPSFSVLKAEVHCGEICTIRGVVTRFREICMDLFSFHEESAIQNEVVAMLRAGEDLINGFTAEHKHVIAHECKMVRIHSICAKGTKIGFKKDCGRCRTNVSEKLKVSEKGSLHVSGTQPQVTYMNYRDGKGHSVMGKQQSVRAMGMSIDIHECERRIGQIHKCHLCRRQVRESTGELLKCSNATFGFCKEVVCQGCAEKELDLEFEEFNRIRTNERWFCVHCCSRCPKGSICSNQTFEQQAWNIEQVVTLWWMEDSSTRNSEVTLVISRRALNGEYRENSEKAVKLIKEKHSQRWTRRVTLKLGAYRCRVESNGSSIASTTFQIFPTKENSNIKTSPSESSANDVFSSGKDDGGDVDDEGKPLIGKKWVEKYMKKMGPQRIEWEMSRNCQIGSSDVRTRRSHSFGDGEGGRLIKNCSRTEGFDWRHAKHYPIVQWIPQQVGQSQSDDDADYNKNGANIDIVYSANDWVSEVLSRRARPPVKIGTCQRQFSIDWNSMMYKKMRKVERGIVTGRSEIHGIGLFTLTGYERGDMVIEYAGSVIRTPLGDVREREYQAAGLGTYLFKLNEEQIVDATVRSNRARFTNHSCDPNMIADVITIHGRELVVLRAIRRIPKYSELTFDYKLPYEEDEKLPCLCDSSYCAGVMN